MSVEPTVHVLWHGRTLCPFSVSHGVPGAWPEGYRWVSLLESKQHRFVTCEACKAKLQNPEVRAVGRLMVAP